MSEPLTLAMYPNALGAGTLFTSNSLRTPPMFLERRQKNNVHRGGQQSPELTLQEIIIDPRAVLVYM